MLVVFSLMISTGPRPFAFAAPRGLFMPQLLPFCYLSVK